jgi:lysozyme
MQVSLLLIWKLKEFEGLRLEAYQDAAGVWTIGYGHTGRDVKRGDRISEYWATDLLKRDVEKVAEAVRALNVARTEGQLDALVSFAFNLGIGKLKSSTLLKVIREGGSKAAIKREFRRWVYAGGKRLRGLELRREWEARRFFE